MLSINSDAPNEKKFDKYIIEFNILQMKMIMIVGVNCHIKIL